MFDPWCPTCGRRVLLGTRRIVHLHHDEAGRLRLDLRCFCGTVVGSASAAPSSDRTELEASAAPAGPDAPPPRPAEGASPPPAAAGLIAAAS